MFSYRGRLNCTTREAVVVSSDIAGNGILAAFSLSALMTITALIYGYYSDSLPESCTSETDKAIIAEIQRFGSLIFTTRLAQGVLKTWRSCLGWVRRRILRKNRPRVTLKLSRAKREEAVTRFVLSLSDQQLATGLAILVAAAVNQCTLSVHEFRIAFALAWFSSTTHLATLNSLRDYFKRHEIIRNWRVFFMVVLLILLLYCFAVVLVASNADATVPVQCVFKGQNQAMYDHNPPLEQDFMAWVATLVILLASYKKRIFQTRGHHSSNAYSPGLTSARTWAFISRKVPRMSNSEWNTVLDELAAERTSSYRKKILKDIMMVRQKRSTTTLKKFLYRWQNDFHSWKWAAYISIDSALPMALTTLFMLSYGLAQMAFFRWNSEVSPQVDMNMGFGQITSLLLLILPGFAAADIYYEAKTESRLPSHQIDSPNFGVSSHGLASESYEMEEVQRADTLPTASSADLDDLVMLALEQAGQQYDANIQRIKKLFYKRSKRLERINAMAADENDCRMVLQMKQVLLLRTKELDGVEHSLVGTMNRRDHESSGP